jgi:MoaA/NifB/PqqE/SkfB family radical SAM enzyme
MSKTFCILPWIHAQTKPNGQIKPCCRFDTKHVDYCLPDKTYKFDKFNINDEHTSFTSALESPEWQEIRETMLKDEKVSGCRKCYQEEEFSFDNNYKNPRRRTKSMRGKENWTRNNKNLTAPEDNFIKITYLEITMGNYCNLKCRTCDSDLSTTWEDDDAILSNYYKERKVTKINNIEKEWSVADFSKIEEIKFTGGEPMLHPNFIKILDILIQSGRADQITLDIYTNASWVPKEKVLTRLDQFFKVHINLSVDGYGYINDYIRYPSEWSTVNESVCAWLKLEKQHTSEYCEEDGTGTLLTTKYIVKWVPCISIYNVWHFHMMIDWWFSLQKEFRGRPWWDSKNYMVNIVHDPKFLKPSLYPNKKLLIHKLLAHKDKLVEELKLNVTDKEAMHESELNLNTMYNKVVGSINEEFETEQLTTFINYTADLDRIRGQDIRTHLPHLWKRFEDIIEYKGRIDEDSI